MRPGGAGGGAVRVLLVWQPCCSCVAALVQWESVVGMGEGGWGGSKRAGVRQHEQGREYVYMYVCMYARKGICVCMCIFSLQVSLSLSFSLSLSLSLPLSSSLSLRQVTLSLPLPHKVNQP